MAIVVKILELLYKTPSLFELKIEFSYVIEVADSESDLGLHNTTLVSELLAFVRIRVSYIFDFGYLFPITIRENVICKLNAILLISNFI